MFVDFRSKKSVALALAARGEKQERLFQAAREARQRVFFDRVEVRSVIEYSNICRQKCCYCGMSQKADGLKRYILNDDDVMRRVERLYCNGRRVMMFQAGEFYAKKYWSDLGGILNAVKKAYPKLVIIGSFGNITQREFEQLRRIGVERYLLKFETSDPVLYRKIKPSDTLANRLKHIRMARDAGFQVSTGNITGLPGQTLATLADDLFLLKKFNFPMGSTSAFIPNDMSMYRHFPAADIDTVLNFMALLRLMCPAVLMPSTSSLELIVKDGQYRGLMAGANEVTVHDGTPATDEAKFVIYRKKRYKPKNSVFRIIKKAGLRPSHDALLGQRSGLA